jgi:hypothetical protein
MSIFNSTKEKFAKKEIKLIKKERRGEGKKMNNEAKTDRDEKGTKILLASVCKMVCCWKTSSN